ncbi:MAG TPA: PHB depolymerase family esterase [Rubrobacteraceae bacterium]|nr:PHB depolymerase family esterase [Rubrobacteraceae bacterium]
MLPPLPTEHCRERLAYRSRLYEKGEATAAIQRALGGISAPAVISENTSGTEGPAETTGWALEGSSRPPESANFGRIGDAPRGGRGPSRHYRGVSRLPNGLPSLPNSLPNDLPALLDGLPSSLPDVLSGGLQDGLLGPTKGMPGPAVVPAGGRFVERAYAGPAGGRAYKLYVPSGYNGQEELPLIVMLHGCTQNPDDFAAGTSMNELAETQNFLVAYPAQAQNANMQQCWNWFQTSDQQRGQGEPAIIAGITRQIIDEYNVAEGRVYVAGMSAGGAMAAIMGATHPDLYAAVGVHSGLAPGAAHDLASAFSAMRCGGSSNTHQDAPTAGSELSVPVIVFHGDRDTTVHPHNAEQLLAHYYRTVNGTPPPGSSNAAGTPVPPVAVRKGQVPGGHAYTHATRPGAEGRPIMEQWIVHGLGHAWSGGSSAGSYTDAKGPDASTEMVRFFDQQHARTSLSTTN